MELKGKKIVFLGDSITEGCGTSAPEYRFPERLQARYGLAEIVNCGISGTRYAKQRVPSAKCAYDMDFCLRVDLMPRDADVVIVFGGTNDFGHGDAPFGTDGDRTPETFCGACHYLFGRLSALYPDAVTVIIPPIHRCGENDPYGDGCKKTPCPPLGAYVDRICRTAEEYRLPVLDLYGSGVLDPNEPSVKERFVPDGLHPNDAGHAVLADEIGKFLEAL